jgi:hypothetical protein
MCNYCGPLAVIDGESDGIGSVIDIDMAVVNGGSGVRSGAGNWRRAVAPGVGIV